MKIVAGIVAAVLLADAGHVALVQRASAQPNPTPATQLAGAEPQTLLFPNEAEQLMQAADELKSVLKGLTPQSKPARATQLAGAEPQTRLAPDAADLYLRAGKLIKVESPTASNLIYRDYPPFNEEWKRLAMDAWEKNRPARELVREARSINQATWPGLKDLDNLLNSLSECRKLVNDLGDAALYAQVQQDDAEAIEDIRDLLHLADMLQQKTPLVGLLVSAGCETFAAHRAMVIISGVVLTTDAKDTHDLQISEARKLMQQLFTQRSLKDQVNDADAQENPLIWIVPQWQPSLKKIFDTLNRTNAERNFAAMSLACHVFRFEKGRWPQSLNELVPAYMPKAPADPWGDDGETFSYALIKGGLPDGSDRPLVYCRMDSRQGLFYRLDRPEYGFYSDDGTNHAVSVQKHGGQFRDVARWAPPAGGSKGPATRALVP